MRVKIKQSRNTIHLTLSTRQKRQIQKKLGETFEARITKTGMLLHANTMRYTLSDLLAQYNNDEPHSQEMKEWLDMPAVGKEII